MRLAVCLSSLLATTFVVACSDDNKDALGGTVVYDDFPATSAGADRSEDLGIAHAFVLQAGFAGGKAIQYADFGAVNPNPPKVYVMVRNGAPVPGQFPIVDTLPDKPDYGPWWQVVEVAAPSGYKANDLKSLKGIEDAGYAQTAKLAAVQCAIVNPDATWVTADLSATLNVFWATGELQPNPYFDPEAEPGPENPVVVTEAGAKEGDIVLQPVWHKRLQTFCFSEGLDKTLPLVDVEGVATLDDATLGARFDVGGLPVFERGADATDYHSLVLAADTVTTVPGQPGSTADVDAENAEPYAYLDNSILGDLALDRFEVTIENTTPAAPDALALVFGQGALLVADTDALDTDEDGTADTAYLFADGLPVSAEVAALVAEGNNVPLAGAFAGDPLLGPAADYQTLGPIAPEASTTTIVLASPFLGVLTHVQALPIVADGFTGVSGVALYDDTGAAFATQTEELFVWNAGLADGSDAAAPSTTRTAAVGKITINHLAP